MKKQTTVKKTRQATHKEVVDTGKLDPAEAEELVKEWFKCPPPAMVNMFYTYFFNGERFETQRAVTYHLEPGALADIISKYELAGSAAELKVYMGCSPEFIKSEIREDAPGFIPFVQLDILDAKLPAFSNCYESVWRTRSTSPLNYNLYPSRPDNDPPLGDDPSRISPYTAHLFLQEWSLTNDEDIEGMFRGIVSGQIQRVSSFTFIEEDLKEIAEIYKDDTSKELFIHLSVIKPNTRSPFGFHVVIELANVKDDNSYAEDGSSTFFEFSSPCPPFCRDKDS